MRKETLTLQQIADILSIEFDDNSQFARLYDEYQSSANAQEK
jgi:hypothetical protein